MQNNDLIMIRNLYNNIQSFCKYKFMLIQKYIKKEKIQLTTTDNIDDYVRSSSVNTIDLKNNYNEHFIIQINKDLENETRFYFIVINNLTQKQVGYIENQINEMNNYISNDKKAFKKILAISSYPEIQVILKLKKLNLDKDQIFNIDELSININQFLNINTIPIYKELVDKPDPLLIGNNSKINGDSQNCCLFTKLYYHICPYTLKGIDYESSMPYLSINKESRYYKK